MDPRSMTRTERLAEVQRRWSEWARTATTDEPPDELFADLALPESYWHQLDNTPHNGTVALTLTRSRRKVD